MALSKKTNNELIAELKKLQKKVAELEKNNGILSKPLANRRLKNTNVFAFLMHSKNFIVMVDEVGVILDINKTDDDLKDSQVIGVNIATFITSESTEITKNALSEVFKNQNPQTYHTSRVLQNGDEVFYLNTLTPIVENKKVIAAIIEAEDVTSEIEIHNELVKSEQKFEKILQNATDVVYRYAIYPERKLEYMSPAVEKMSGYAAQEFYDDNTLAFKIIHPDDVHTIETLQQQYLKNEIPDVHALKPRVVRWIKKDGSIIWVETVNSNVYDNSGKLIAVDGFARNVTERILNEQNILLSRHAELVPGLIFQYQVFPDGRYFFPYASSKIWDIFEVTAEQAKISGASVFARVLDEDKAPAVKSIRKSMKTLQDWDHEFRVNLPSKGIRWLSGHAKPEKLPDGSYLWHGYYYDITDRKIILEQINQSLQEKEVLLKEVHHRVKNNLQVISSILNLQSSYVKDEATVNVLRESQNRIKSMAFIHESLYQANDFSSINFADYVVNLLQNLMQSYSKLNQTVKLNVELETIFLNLDLAIPCGLIINEIISNALKYAFVENKEGDEITIKMKKVGEKLQLVIGDNGVGLPKNIDYKNTESLGLQLVVTLVGQLGGNIELDSTNGTKYTISFLM
jgi:PAS domain S-box-containing protein